MLKCYPYVTIEQNTFFVVFFSAAITMYIRYLLIEKQNESSHFVRSSCNMFTLCIGLMGCTGMGIVATFQV